VAARNGTGTRKSPPRNASNSAQGGRGNPPPPNRRLRRYATILFWLTFIIVIYGLFLFNREAITDSIQIIRNERAARESPPVAPPVAPLPPAAIIPAPLQPPAIVPPVVLPPPEEANDVPAPLVPAPPPPAELLERTLYFTQVDRNGMIFRSGVNRRLPASATPMTDVLHALIAGPSEDERRRGLITLIPEGTRILSATVRDGTAYINFSEDFRYNTYGVEGYIAQIRQVLYTVTEFPNIQDVQILIGGHRANFLGEGIWIGSPLRRGMF